MQFRTPLILLLLIFTVGLGAEENKSDPISYYEVKPSLVTNLTSGGKYIRTDIQLMTRDASFQEQLDLHGPAIRHTLLMLLSEQDGDTLRSAQGKEALRQQALAQINKLMLELTGKSGPEALFFTTFFVQ